jgi:cobalt-zinc-cadmium resistance protein CzcA
MFLGNLRSALIVAAPFRSRCSSPSGSHAARGESANLLSVGAIDFGLIVDATVIMVENIFRHLSQPPRALPRSARCGAPRAPPMGLRGKFAVIANAATEVNQAIFFSAAIIIAGFVPLFT